jgi:outer membrane lipoprotein-sorting protein
MLRRLPTSRLLALLAALAGALAAGTVIAVAAIGGSGPTPPAKPLNAAIHDAVNAPPVDGVTARITFTNHLIDGSSLSGQGGSPLLSGATGRLWAAADGRLRLELQSAQGDAQVTSDGKTVTVYDATQNTAYKIALPAGKDHAAPSDGPPTLQRIDDLLARLAEWADVSAATPSNVAGRPAYTVHMSPKHDGGLIGAAELAWDAANGTPLRAAIYASGNPNPVLELKVTDIAFGKVADADLAAAPPTGTKVQTVDLTGSGQDPAGGDKPVTGVKEVAAKLSFPLSAPDTLVGLPRHEVRLISADADKGALVTYGAGLGGIAVLEQPAGAAPAAPAPQAGGDHGGLSLPKISIDGTSGEELATALGTVVRFERGGVSYTVIGSVPPAAAEAAARAL